MIFRNDRSSIAQCLQNCPVTLEQQPVCGSDGVTYANSGRLICAKFCGIGKVRFRCSSNGTREQEYRVLDTYMISFHCYIYALLIFVNKVQSMFDQGKYYNKPVTLGYHVNENNN